MLGEAGDTNTVATVSLVTVMADVPCMSPLVAVMVAKPGETPLTTPALLTIATEVLSLDQLLGWPLIKLPEPSRTVAVSVTVLPTSTTADAGLTVTEPTFLALDGPMMSRRERQEVMPLSSRSEAMTVDRRTAFRWTGRRDEARMVSVLPGSAGEAPLPRSL